MKKSLLMFLPDITCALLSILIASFVLSQWPFAFYIVLLADILLFAYDFYVFMKASRRPVNAYLIGFVAAFVFSLVLFLNEVSRNWQWDFLIAFASAYACSLLFKIDHKLFARKAV